MIALGISLGLFLGLGCGAYASRHDGPAPVYVVPACIVGATVQATIALLVLVLA